MSKKKSIKRKSLVKKSPEWYKAEIKRIDRWIDEIRAERFGYKK